MRVPRRHAWLALLTLTPGILVGFDYGTTVLVRSEGDIQELWWMGEIDEELRDQLLELYSDPLDLNTATRDELVLLPELTHAMADAIIARRAQQAFTSPRQLRALVGPDNWAQCRPFVTVSSSRGPGPKGSVSLRSTEKLEDDRAPVAWVKARVRYEQGIEAGIIIAEQSDLYGVAYSDDGISVQGRRPTVMLERAHVQLDRGSWSTIFGHYAIGFGQRLGLDVTDKLRPHGFSRDLRINQDYENHDSYTVPKRLLGAAASTTRALGEAELDLTVFASADPHDLYRNYFSPSDYTVDDPDEEDEVGLYPTFPRLYREDLAGLNSTLHLGEHAQLGLTAWAGHLDRRMDFTFTSYAMPNRDWYGAVAVDGAASIGATDLYAEVAVTDSGGLGARAEGVLSTGLFEGSLALRYYGTGFDNPHSGAASQADQYSLGEDEVDELDERTGGWRDRDELGPQVALVLDPAPWVRARVKGDLWHQPSTGLTHAWAESRLNLDPLAWLGLDLLASLRDKDLAEHGRQWAYDDDDDSLDRGQKLGLGAGLSLHPVEPVVLRAFAKQNAYDHADYPDGLALDRYGWLELIAEPGDRIELSARVKRYDARTDTESGDAYTSARAQLRARPAQRFTVLARYERVLDQGEDQAEHKLKAGLDLRF
jgi:hypothetical protein